MDKLWLWPDDYLPLDDGRLFVRPDYLHAFESRGWTTTAAVLADKTVHVVREVGTRDNCRLEFSASGGQTIRAYLKRHHQRNPRWGVGERRPAGLAEADAVGWCQRAGTPTMAVIAAGQHPDKGTVGSFFLSEEIPGGAPADDFWKMNHDPSIREAALAALADCARRFHQADLFHRDFYWCHFFVRPIGGVNVAAHLIDLQRVLRKPVLRARWLVKDLGQFWYSAPHEVTAAQRNEWFERYRGLGADQTAARRWTSTVLSGLAGYRAAFYRFKDGAS
jgi:hypothetical protein